MIQGPFRIDVSDNKNPERPKNVKVKRKKEQKKKKKGDKRSRERDRKRRVYERGIYSPRLADRRYS